MNDDGRLQESLANTDLHKLQKELSELIVPKSLFTMDLDVLGDGHVISVDVPVGQDRPYVFDGSIYVRVHGEIRKAGPEEMRRMVAARAAEPERWERRAAMDLALEDLDERLIMQTARNGGGKRSYRFRDPQNNREVLGDLGLLRNGQLTNAADVLFGKDVAVRQPQTRLRAVHYETDKGGRYIDDQLFDGPALDLLESAMKFLKRNVSVASDFPRGSLHRASKPEYPFEALREGLVNALVHRDYALFSGSVTLSIYPGRIEIWNTGRLPKGVDVKDLARNGHLSVLVNPDISLGFYLHELMERVGRGTYKIVQECRAIGLRTPKWEVDEIGVRLILFGDKAKKLTLDEYNKRQQGLLTALELGESIRLADYVNRFATGITERQARRDLTELYRAGLLGRDGAGSSTRYQKIRHLAS